MGASTIIGAASELFLPQQQQQIARQQWHASSQKQQVKMATEIMVIQTHSVQPLSNTISFVEGSNQHTNSLPAGCSSTNS
mmetsp:Transcript_16494/g.22120  ORF Transcript_16494/g.22120 Transcript_16494/m.22120 type:complete len:80 (-) Transcript_16494:863-1102(-)